MEKVEVENIIYNKCARLYQEGLPLETVKGLVEVLIERFTDDPMIVESTIDSIQFEIDEYATKVTERLEQIDRIKEGALALGKKDNYFYKLDEYGYPSFLEGLPNVPSIYQLKGPNEDISNAYRVIAEGKLDGYIKTNSDNHQITDMVELVTSSMGMVLGVETAATYGMLNNNLEFIGTISENVAKSSSEKFVSMASLEGEVKTRIKNGEIKDIPLNNEISRITNVMDKKPDTIEEYQAVIAYGLKVIELQPGITMEDYQECRKGYFDMIMFDLITNQANRKPSHYGLVQNEATSEYAFAPLFNNASSKEGLEEVCLNGFTCDKKRLEEALYTGYYDDIRETSKRLVEEKEENMETIRKIAYKNLPTDEAETFVEEVEASYDNISRLEKEHVDELTTSNTYDEKPLELTKSDAKKLLKVNEVPKGYLIAKSLFALTVVISTILVIIYLINK